jgi:hypothetical protein
MNRKTVRIALFSLCVFLTACGTNDPYSPDEYLSAAIKDKLITSLVRYTSKPPKGVSGVERFDARFNDYYLEQASKVKLERLFEKDGYLYFLISQPAPSVVVKRNATAGKVKLGNDGDIIAYQEIFRTWKMLPDTLERRSYFLFEKLTKGEALTNYYSEVSGDQYIEFPDNRTYFDTLSREWRTR